MVSYVYKMMTHRGCQTEKVMDSLQDSHYAKIWQKERESELSLARETAVALAKAGWELENEKTVRSRVDIIVKSKKDEWSREAYRANEKEVDSLKSQLKDAVSKTEDMRRKIELEYKNSLSKANEEYKTEMNRLLKTERDKSSKCERRLNLVQSELERCKADISTLRNEKSTFMQDELKQRMELDKLSVMFDQLKASEKALKDKSEKAAREIERLKNKMEQYSRKENATRTQCEAVITQMKEELLGYAENANRQAMEFVQKAVAQCKETTAGKYKKYYQRLLYCLIEKHPNIKGTVKHLQLTLPKQVPRTPLTSSASPRSKPVNLDLLTQCSVDSGLPSTQSPSYQSPTRLLRSPTCARFNCSDDHHSEVSPGVRRKLHLTNKR